MKQNMKLYIVAALLVGLLVGYVVARQKYTTIMMEKDKMIMDRDEKINGMTEREKMMPDANMKGVMMKNGEMMEIMTNGETTKMDKDVMYSDGTKIMMNGTVTKPDGSTMMMHDGDEMMMPTGTMMEK